MFIKIAIKNICAYRKRSIITVALTAFSTALLIFSSALMTGSHNKMLANAVEVYPGYLQITQKDFRDVPSYDNLIFDVKAMRRKLSSIPGIAAIGARFETFVLFAAENKTVGGMLAGIEPKNENRLSRLAQSLKEGSYLSDGDAAQVYLGVGLAKKLQVKVGDTLAFVGTGADYSFSADTLYVKGIFQTGSFDFDNSTAFVNKAYFDDAMAAENYATQIIVLPQNPSKSDALAEQINQQLGTEYQALGWRKSMDGLVEAMELDSVFGYISLAIIFLVIFFVIMIYTLLNIMGRSREIGMMRALGTTPGQVFIMLWMECLILGMLSVFIGGLFGGGLTAYFHFHPIQLSGYEEQFKQYGLMAAALPTVFRPIMIARDILIILTLSLFAAIYPIFKVNRYRPLEAIHHV